MTRLNEILDKYSIRTKRIKKMGKVTIVYSDSDRFVFKDSKINDTILSYLMTRSFDYMPKIIENKDYILTEYVEDLIIPREQKIIDLIKLTALLHSKTTHYKEIDKDDYEQLYDDLNNNLEYLYGYYTDLISLIETKIIPSPSEQLLSRNITKIYETIANNKKRLSKWHSIVKEKTKERNVVLHNNLKLSHFIRNKNSYLISWDKAKLGIPIFDLYKLYLNHALEFDFEPLLKIYEHNYPLLDDEKYLFYILISMPDIIELKGVEYERCLNISRMLDKIYKTEKIVSPDAPKHREEV